MTTPTASLPIIPALAAPLTASVSLPASVVLPAPRRATVGLVMAVASALAFSSSGPLVKPLLESGWSLGAALLVRIGVAAVVLSPFLVRAIVRERAFLRRHWPSLVAFGVMPVAGCQLFYFSAMQRMPVAVALLIQYLAPVMLVLWAWLRTRRRPSTPVLAGAVVAVAGLVLVVDVVGARVDPLGALFALGAAICVCVYFGIAERADDDLPPLALAAGGMLVGALFVGGLVVTGILPFATADVPASVLGNELPAALVLVGVGVATTLGYAWGIAAVPRTGARLASFVGLSEVLFALGFAWLLLGETPAPVQFLGGALILAGVVLVRFDTAGAVTPAVDPVPAADAPGAR